jgi:hypothetical protein
LPVLALTAMIDYFAFSMALVARLNFWMGYA